MMYHCHRSIWMIGVSLNQFILDIYDSELHTVIDTTVDKIGSFIMILIGLSGQAVWI
jgi:hypothetical protein